MSTRVLTFAVILLAVAVGVLCFDVVRLERRVGALADSNVALARDVGSKGTSLSVEIGRLEKERGALARLLAAAPDEARSTVAYVIAQKARLATRARHEETRAAMFAIMGGLGSYQVDYNMYPLPPLENLQPNYLRHPSKADAWGHPYQYTVAKNRLSYTLSSPGQDGKPHTRDDYVAVEGQFLDGALPEMRDLTVDPLDLPGEEPLDPSTTGTR